MVLGFRGGGASGGSGIWRGRLRCGGIAVRVWRRPQRRSGQGAKLARRPLGIASGIEPVLGDHADEGAASGAAPKGAVFERFSIWRILRHVAIFCRFVGLRLRKLDGFAGQRGHLVCGTDATFGAAPGRGAEGAGSAMATGPLIGGEMKRRQLIFGVDIGAVGGKSCSTSAAMWAAAVEACMIPTRRSWVRR